MTVAVLLIVVLVVGVSVSGIVPGWQPFRGGPSANANLQDSAAALSRVTPLAASLGAGSLVAVVGVSTTYSYGFGTGLGNTTCPLLHGPSANLTVPGSTADYASGEAVLWVFVYVNASSVNSTIIASVEGTLHLIGSVAGARCVPTTSPLPTSFVSSTRVATSLEGVDGPFVGAHAAANAAYTLVMNGSSPVWTVGFTNCSYYPGNHTFSGGTKGDLFGALVNASSSGIRSALTTLGGVNCGTILGGGGGPGLTPLGSAFAFGPGSNITSSSSPVPAGCAVAKECYSLEIAAAASGLTWADVSFSARTPTGAVEPVTGWTFTAVSIVGTAMTATWSGSGSCQGVACTTLVSAGTSLVIDTGVAVGASSSLQGVSIIAIGQGSFSGTVTSSSLPA